MGRYFVLVSQYRRFMSVAENGANKPKYQALAGIVRPRSTSISAHRNRF